MRNDFRDVYLRYLSSFALTAIILLGCIAVFCIVIDPYMIFDSPTFTGINKMKPRAYQQASLAKAHLLQRTAPTTLVLGNSRVEIGLDPASREWPHDLQPVFNAAQAGAGYDVALERLREALADDRRLSLVLLGVDFQDFLVTPTSKAADATSDTDASASLARPKWTTLATATLTFGAFQDSLMTLFGQDAASGVTMRPDGFNPLRDYNVHIRRIGQFGLFAQKQAEYRALFPLKPRPDFSKPDSLLPYRLIQQIIGLALSNGVPIVLIIQPYHASYLSMLTEIGLRDSFCSWIRSIVLLVDNSADPMHRASARLIDFSGYNVFTLEPVPTESDRVTNMQWYWESGHYRGSLGNQILRRLFGGDVGFGVELASTSHEPLEAEEGHSSTAFAASPGFCSAKVADVRDTNGQHAVLNAGP